MLVAQVLKEEPQCQLRLLGCTGKSQTADHKVPVSVQPELCMIRAKLRGACLACQYRRGARSLEAAANPSTGKRKKKPGTVAEAMDAAQAMLDAFGEAEQEARRRPAWREDAPHWKPIDHKRGSRRSGWRPPRCPDS